MTIQKSGWLALLGLIALTLPTLALADKAPVYTALFSDTALKGYDPVAYFELGKATKGSKQFKTSWNGAQWWFVSAEHRDAFIAAPEQYAPQYGGYCAWAVGNGYTASGDPEVWSIVDGKLYVNYNESIGEKWQKDRAALIKSADANWPDVLK